MILSDPDGNNSRVIKLGQFWCTFHRLVVKSILNSTYGIQSVKDNLVIHVWDYFEYLHSMGNCIRA